VYIVGLSLGSSYTLLGCTLSLCLCTLLGLSWQFVYIVGLYLSSLSINAQLIMQCCNVVLGNVTACLGLHQNMYEVSELFFLCHL
jgi:hypothetical protein